MENIDFSIFFKLSKTFLGIIRDTRGSRLEPGNHSGEHRARTMSLSVPDDPKKRFEKFEKIENS